MKLILLTALNDLLFVLCLCLVLTESSQQSRLSKSRVDQVKKDALLQLIKNDLAIKHLIHHKIRTTPAPPACLTQTLFIPLPYLTPYPDPNGPVSPWKYPNRRCSSSPATTPLPMNCPPPTPRPYFPPCGKGVVYSVNYFHP